MNLGWRAADAEYVFFLHDDTIIQPATVRILADALDNRAEAAAVCPLLVDSLGQPAPQLGNLPPDGTWRPARPGPPTDVEYARGAAIMFRVYFIKALRQIDERYGQFGADADLAAEIRRANRKILLVPSAIVQHEARGAYSTVEKADFLNARAVFLGKHQGMAAGLQARLGAVLGPLAGFRFSELKHTIGAQKIDGTQE
jgi:GT2 family glycosyltransferase